MKPVDKTLIDLVLAKYSPLKYELLRTEQRCDFCYSVTKANAHVFSIGDATKSVTCCLGNVCADKLLGMNAAAKLRVEIAQEAAPHVRHIPEADFQIMTKAVGFYEAGMHTDYSVIGSIVGQFQRTEFASPKQLAIVKKYVRTCEREAEEIEDIFGESTDGEII